MPVVTLTDLTLRNLKPVEGRQVIYLDRTLKGFGVRISEKGAMSFVLTYGADRKRVKIGDVGIIKLTEARAEARRILAERTLGKDIPPSMTVEAALAVFLADAEKRTKSRTTRDYTRLLRRHLAKLFRASLADVSARDLAHIQDRLGDTPSEAAHALVAIKVFFNWCVRRGYVAISPCARLTAAKSPSRDRVLNDAELKLVYDQALTFPFPFGAIVRLLILTGQRRSEIGLLRWEWIDADKRTISLPPEITKNNRPHTFPYGQMVTDILDTVPRSDGYVFPAAREHVKGRAVRTINGWSNSKKAFDKLALIAPWTLHDLRRTFATNLAALGTPIHVTEKLLNHVSGTTGGLVAVYQRHAYMDEMRAAVFAWEKRLSELLA
jgi:integrase